VGDQALQVADVPPFRRQAPAAHQVRGCDREQGQDHDQPAAGLAEEEGGDRRTVTKPVSTVALWIWMVSAALIRPLTWTTAPGRRLFASPMDTLRLEASSIRSRRPVSSYLFEPSGCRKVAAKPLPSRWSGSTKAPMRSHTLAWLIWLWLAGAGPEGVTETASAGRNPAVTAAGPLR